MSSTIELIFTSSVVAVICTGIFSMINNRKNNITGYVTEERREWRKEIKNIADELTMTNGIYEIRSLLSKLKVRINPYGKGKKGAFMQDFHIWELISVMEENPYENQSENKEKLLMYISLLLKYDYDKTEKIVEGRRRIYIMTSLILIVLGSIYMIYIHFFERGDEYNDIFLTTWMMFLISPVAIAFAHPKKEILGIFRKKRKIRYKVLIGIGIVLICVDFAVGLITLIYIIFSYYGITWQYLYSAKGYLETTIVVSIMAAIFAVAKSGDEDNVEKDYEAAVKQIYYQNENLSKSNIQEKSTTKKRYGKKGILK